MTSQPGMTVYLATKLQDHIFRGVTYTAPTTVYVKQHVGPPGPVGTANPSAVTTRLAATWAASAGAIISLTTPYAVFTETATESETWVSLWDAATGGNCLHTGILTTPVSEQSGYTFTFNACTIDWTNLLAS